MASRAATVATAVAVILAATLIGAAAVSYEPVTGEITLQTNTGVAVSTSAHDGGQDLSDPFVNDSTVRVVTQGGNLTVSGSGSAAVTVDSFGDPLETSSLSVSNAVTLNPPNRPAVTIQGDADTFTYHDPALDDGATDFEYSGASGDTTVTIRGLPADTTVSVIDEANNRQILAVAETDSNGVLTVTLPNSAHSIELQSGDQSNAPELSNLEPSGEVADTPITARVDVDDPDFDSAGEDVQTTLYLDGQQITQQNRTSSGEVSTQVSSLTGGTHNLTAVAVDAFGNRDRVETTFGVPTNFTVRNESDTSQTIANANVTLYIDSNETVYSRTSDANGNVSLRNLPLNRPVIAEVRHPDYNDRTYYFDSLAEQHTAYLLPENTTTADIVYILDDQTGEFDPPQDTALSIKKPVNTTSGDTEYVTVVSDRFDATEELPVTLEVGQRYRLEVQSPDGTIRSIGNYRVTGDDPSAVLTIGAVRLAGDTDTGGAFGATLIEQAGNRVVRYQYVDPDGTTEQLNVTIYETGNESNVLLNETTVATDLGTYTETVIVPPNASDDIAYTVEYEATFGDNSTQSDTRYVGDVPEIAKQFGLAPNVLSLLGWATLIGLTGFVAIASAPVAAVVAVVTATALTWIGALPVPAPLLAVAGGIAVLMTFSDREAP